MEMLSGSLPLCLICSDKPSSVSGEGIAQVMQLKCPNKKMSLKQALQKGK